MTAQGEARGELLPCRQCGGRADILPALECGDSAYVVQCSQADCAMSSKVIFALKEDVTDLLIAAWNRRPERASPPVEAVEAARRLLMDRRLDGAFMNGVTAGWNAAQSDDPNEALARIQEAHCRELREANDDLKAARALLSSSGEKI